VVQTHIHEDFASGACALAMATGSAEVCVSGHDAPEYGFSHRAVHDGDVLELGAVRLTVKHTPGHTPEHISLLVAKTATKDAPFAVLSGGSLLVETAGRTDLLGAAVRFDLPAHRVEITSGTASADVLSQSIRDAGYTPVAASATTAAAPKKGGCCCG